MSGLIMPQVVYGLSNDELAELVAKALKEIDWAFNGNISDQNISRIANFLASKTELKHISGIVGMSGFDPANPLAIRFWAGDADKSIAPFRVQQDGHFYASDGDLTGNINALSGRIGGFVIALNKIYSVDGNGIIEGGTIRTAESGSRIELTGGVLKGFSELGNLHGLVFSPTPVSNFFDLFLYHEGVKILEFIDNANSVTIKGSSSSVSMVLGGSTAPTIAAGSWTFTGNATFNNDINGKASEAYFADHAATASAADELSPSGEIAWAQVLKGGSDIADLSTRNLSSLTQNSSFRTVTDTEKSTWNDKWSDNTTLSRSAARYTQSSTQVVTSNSWTKVEYTTKDYDYKNEFSTVNSRLTVTGSGLYTVSASVIFAAVPDTTEIILRLYINGSAGPAIDHNRAGSAGYYSTQGCTTIHLNANDYVEVYVVQISPGSLTTGGDPSFTYFSAVKVA